MKFKKKKKNQMGYFYSMSPGNPKYNAEMFNHLMGSGDMPEAPSGGSGEACGESLTEDQKKNTYEIVYLNRYDEKGYAYIDAYSEKQAAIILKKQRKGIYRILSIDCIEDHSKDDGEQIGLFEVQSPQQYALNKTNKSRHGVEYRTLHHPLDLDDKKELKDVPYIAIDDDYRDRQFFHSLLTYIQKADVKSLDDLFNRIKNLDLIFVDYEDEELPITINNFIDMSNKNIFNKSVEKVKNEI